MCRINPLVVFSQVAGFPFLKCGEFTNSNIPLVPNFCQIFGNGRQKVLDRERHCPVYGLARLARRPSCTFAGYALVGMSAGARGWYHASKEIERMRPFSRRQEERM